MKRLSGGGHSSRLRVASQFQHPTRMSSGAGHAFIPIWICSVWGLPGLFIAKQPVRSYRTFSPLPIKQWRGTSGEWGAKPATIVGGSSHHSPLVPRHCFIGGIFSVALSVLDQDLRPSRAPRVTGHTTLWSSDFPPAQPARD